MTYVFAAHWHRQAGQDGTWTDPEKKTVAEFHHVKMNHLLQNLLSEIVDGNAFRCNTVQHLVHFVNLMLSVVD